MAEHAPTQMKQAIVASKREANRKDQKTDALSKEHEDIIKQKIPQLKASKGKPSSTADVPAAAAAQPEAEAEAEAEEAETVDDLEVDEEHGAQDLLNDSTFNEAAEWNYLSLDQMSDLATFEASHVHGFADKSSTDANADDEPEADMFWDDVDVAGDQSQVTRPAGLGPTSSTGELLFLSQMKLVRFVLCYCAIMICFELGSMPKAVCSAAVVHVCESSDRAHTSDHFTSLTQVSAVSEFCRFCCQCVKLFFEQNCIDIHDQYLADGDTMILEYITRAHVDALVRERFCCIACFRPGLCALYIHRSQLPNFMRFR